MSRPSKVPGVTPVIRTGCGKIYITDSTDPEFPEVFIRLGKTGGCQACFCEALGRVISFALRAGTPREQIVHALQGIRCPAPQWDEGVQILSCPDAIAKALKETPNEEQSVEV